MSIFYFLFGFAKTVGLAPQASPAGGFAQKRCLEPCDWGQARVCAILLGFQTPFLGKAPAGRDLDGAEVANGIRARVRAACRVSVKPACSDDSRSRSLSAKVTYSSAVANRSRLPGVTCYQPAVTCKSRGHPARIMTRPRYSSMRRRLALKVTFGKSDLQISHASIRGSVCRGRRWGRPTGEVLDQGRTPFLRGGNARSSRFVTSVAGLAAPVRGGFTVACLVE